MQLMLGPTRASLHIVIGVTVGLLAIAHLHPQYPQYEGLPNWGAALALVLAFYSLLHGVLGFIGWLAKAEHPKHKGKGADQGDRQAEDHGS